MASPIFTQSSEVVVSALTIFLAKLIGLYALLFGLAMFAQRQAMIEIATAIIRSGPPLLILAMLRIVTGLAIVLGHNVWSGGALPLIVTLLGCIVLIRGTILLFLSPQAAARLFEMLHFEERYYLYAGITVALGLYLTYAGFAN